MPKTPPTVWRALADPTRRRLIELLRGGPRTTSDLARAFSTTRFAVMKHLRVLEAAGLVRARRAGRRRWNELLPAPLVGIQDRWEGLEGATAPPRHSAGAHAPAHVPPARVEAPPAQAEAGAGLAEASPAQTPPPAEAPRGVAGFHVTLQVFLDAAPSRVFDALTFGIAAWWGPPFLRFPDASGVVLEGRLGGRFSEEWGHRQGAIRGAVTAIRQDERIEISGVFGPGAPLPATLAFTLAPREGGTLLHLSHRGLADVVAGSDLADAYRAAWTELLARRLKAFLERGVRAGVGDVPGGAAPSPAGLRIQPQSLF